MLLSHDVPRHITADVSILVIKLSGVDYHHALVVALKLQV